MRIGLLSLLIASAANAQIFVSPVTTPPVFPTTPSLIARYEANNPSNTVTTLSQTFLPSDVDTGNNKLAISGLGFLLLTGTLGPARPVFFDNTGGALPAPLVAGTKYWISPDAVSGYDIYPTLTDAGTVPGGVTGENPIAAQNLSELANRITLTTQGTGTHRIFTDPSYTAIADMSGNGYTIAAQLPTNRHSYLSQHGSGASTYAEIPGTNVRDNTSSISGNIEYGQIGVMSVNKLSGRSQSNNAKVAWATVTALLPVYQKKLTVHDTYLSSGVNTTTGAITASAHPFVTPDLVNTSVYSTGGALPAGLSAGTDYYVNKTDANNYTLHPTQTDATNNTNTIIPSTQGSGTLFVAAPAKVSGTNRFQAFFEWINPINGGNTLSVDISQNGPTGTVSSTSSAFTITGANNGNILNLSLYPDLSKIQLWFPPRGFGPVRTDTGLPLTSGTYWLSASGSSRRLTLSLADAQASVGVATSACTLCVKYTGVDGFGNALINYDDSTATVTIGAGADAFVNRITLGALHVYTIKIDWNPACCAFPTITMWIDGVLFELNTQLTGEVKGNLGSPAVDATTAPWTLWNSIANHVPGLANWRQTAFGVSQTDISDAEILGPANYYKQLYGIP